MASTEPVKAMTIRPEDAYLQYKNLCERNGFTPISYTKFVEQLCISLSANLSVAIKYAGPSITKHPVDDDKNMWCLIAPCSDSTLRLVFADSDTIDDIIEEMLEEMHNKYNENQCDDKTSPLEQF